MIIYFLSLLFPFTSHATCTPTSDCASIGYTETSCETDYLACPFDSTKLKCIPCDSSFRYDCSGDNISEGIGSACAGKYVSCTCSSTDYIFSNGSCVCDTSCKIGAIYYSDGTCSACVDNTKTPIGVVVKDNELVMSDVIYNIQWGSTGADVTTLINYSSTTEAQTDFSGKDNTDKIVAYFGEDVDTSLHAGVFCHKYFTKGTNAGDWYLPAAGELYSYVCGNFSKLGYTASKLDWPLSNYFWSSSECGSGCAVLVASHSASMHLQGKNNNRVVSCLLDIN